MRVAEGNRPQVLNAPTSTSPASSGPPPNGDAVANEKEASLSHRDERQIMLDTDRSFVHYPSGEASPTQYAADGAECLCKVIII
jgi:hypothetical protein